MKVKHVLLIATVLLAMLVAPVVADDTRSGSVDVGADVPASFILKLPESIDFTEVDAGKTTTAVINVTISKINPNSVITVSVTTGNGWYLKHNSGSGDRLAYNMTDGDVEIGSGETIFSTDKTDEKGFIFTLKEGAKKSGKYTDTLTFTAKMVDSGSKTTTVYSTEDLLNAMGEDGITIYLAPGVTFENVVLTGDIVGEGVTIVGTPTSIVKGMEFSLNTFTTDYELKDLTIENVVFSEKGVYFTNYGGRTAEGTGWGFVYGLTMTGCTMTGTGTDDVVAGNRLFDVGADSMGSNQFHDIVIEGCSVSNAHQGIRFSAIYGENIIKGNTITYIGHNAIALKGSSLNADVVRVEDNTISDVTDRVFRMGDVNSESARVIFKNNVITNSGDSSDGTNFKINTFGAGMISFEGNTVDGVEWNPTITSENKVA